MDLHLRGSVLPHGVTRDLWILGDRITFHRPSVEAEPVADGGFLLPTRCWKAEEKHATGVPPWSRPRATSPAT